MAASNPCLDEAPLILETVRSRLGNKRKPSGFRAVGSSHSRPRLQENMRKMLRVVTRSTNGRKCGLRAFQYLPDGECNSKHSYYDVRNLPDIGVQEDSSRSNSGTDHRNNTALDVTTAITTSTATMANIDNGRNL